MRETSIVENFSADGSEPTTGATSAAMKSGRFPLWAGIPPRGPRQVSGNFAGLQLAVLSENGFAQSVFRAEKSGLFQL